MKKTNVIKLIGSVAAVATLAVCTAMMMATPTIALAQSDSTKTVVLRGVPTVKLRNQERETPQITNNSTTNVTQQITQVVQPTTYTVQSSNGGQTTAAAYASCGGGTVLGGGGSCTDNQGLVAVAQSEPSGNGWVIGCQSLNYKYVTATASAVCSGN